MTTCFIDTETFCETPIRDGVHRYAEDVGIMIAAWAIDDGPVVVEDLTDPQADGSMRLLDPSYELRQAIQAADEIVIHNSAFDRAVVHHAWAELQVRIPIEKTHDTLVQALVHGLPGALGKLCAIYNIPLEEAKSEDGKNLIQLFCKPLPKNQKLRRATRLTHPDKWREFLDYAGSDILAMRALRRKLPVWNYQGVERKLWELDQRINERGFLADRELATAAISAIAVEQKRLKAEAHALSDGFLDNPRQREPLLFYLLQEHGVDLPDLKKDTLERRLEDPELPEFCRELIRVRLAATTSSTAKYPALMRAVSSDGALRGSLQFCGAKRTGRWGGRLFQPQNLPRPKAKAEQIELNIAAAKAGNLDLGGNVMADLSDALRGMIIARPGKHLFSSDLANIESVVAAWLTGEEWKLKAFAEIFAAKARGDKTVADMYQRSYAKSFGIADPLTVKGDKRQIGKVQELGLGFEGGVGAFLGFAAVYRIDLDAMAEGVLAAADEAAYGAARGMLEWRRKKRLTTYGLGDRVFIACEIIKAGWREAHPAFKDYWPALNAAAIRAIKHPGETVPVGKISFIRKGAWLRMILPSGRSVCYASPQVDSEGKVSYLGENQYTRKWQRIGTYGGKFFENACQAVARDVMAANMPAIEEAGFEILLTVHDDVICEADDELGLTSGDLSRLLAARPSWMPGCPLYADGFKAQRYRKED